MQFTIYNFSLSQSSTMMRAILHKSNSKIRKCETQNFMQIFSYFLGGGISIFFMGCRTLYFVDDRDLQKLILSFSLRNFYIG